MAAAVSKASSSGAPASDVGQHHRVAGSETPQHAASLHHQLVEACKYSRLEVLKRLLSERPELINYRDRQNRSLLHYSVVLVASSASSTTTLIGSPRVASKKSGSSYGQQQQQQQRRRQFNNMMAPNESAHDDNEHDNKYRNYYATADVTRSTNNNNNNNNNNIDSCDHEHGNEEPNPEVGCVGGVGVGGGGSSSSSDEDDNFLVVNNQIKCFQYLLSKNGRLWSHQDSDGYTVLHLAVISSNLPMVKYIIYGHHQHQHQHHHRPPTLQGDDQQKKQVNYDGGVGGSGQFRGFTDQGQHRSLISICDKELHSPLHWAIITNNLECAKLLLNYAGIQLAHLPDLNSATPLHYATQTSNLLSITSNGCITTTTNSIGFQQNDSSSSSLSSSPAAATTINYKQKIPPNKRNRGSLNESQSQPSNINAKSLEQNRRGSSKLKFELAQQTIDNNNCSTSSSSSHSILAYLLEQPGINIECRDNDMRSPLLWAASSGNLEAVVMLINAGADIESCDKNSLTAIHCAASHGYTDCLEALISLCHPLNVDQLDNLRCTPLFYSVLSGNSDCVETLLEHGAKCNWQDVKGRTAAHFAALKGQLGALKTLHKMGANLWLVNNQGDLPLHYAIKCGRRQVVKWFLEHAPFERAVDAINNYGRAPIHLAIMRNKIELVQFLINQGANLNQLVKMRPHHNYASKVSGTSRTQMNNWRQSDVIQGAAAVTSSLSGGIHHIAGCQAVPYQYETALDMAMNLGHHNCVKLLQLYEAKHATEVIQARQLKQRQHLKRGQSVDTGLNAHGYGSIMSPFNDQQHQHQHQQQQQQAASMMHGGFNGLPQMGTRAAPTSKVLFDLQAADGISPIGFDTSSSACSINPALVTPNNQQQQQPSTSTTNIGSHLMKRNHISNDNHQLPPIELTGIGRQQAVSGTTSGSIGEERCPSMPRLSQHQHQHPNQNQNQNQPRQVRPMAAQAHDSSSASSSALSRHSSLFRSGTNNNNNNNNNNHNNHNNHNYQHQGDTTPGPYHGGLAYNNGIVNASITYNTEGFQPPTDQQHRQHNDHQEPDEELPAENFRQRQSARQRPNESSPGGGRGHSTGGVRSSQSAPVTGAGANSHQEIVTNVNVYTTSPHCPRCLEHEHDQHHQQQQQQHLATNGAPSSSQVVQTQLSLRGPSVVGRQQPSRGGGEQLSGSMEARHQDGGDSSQDYYYYYYDEEDLNSEPQQVATSGSRGALSLRRSPLRIRPATETPSVMNQRPTTSSETIAKRKDAQCQANGLSADEEEKEDDDADNVMMRLDEKLQEETNGHLLKKGEEEREKGAKAKREFTRRELERKHRSGSGSGVSGQRGLQEGYQRNRLAMIESESDGGSSIGSAASATGQSKSQRSQSATDVDEEDADQEDPSHQPNEEADEVTATNQRLTTTSTATGVGGKPYSPALLEPRFDRSDRTDVEGTTIVPKVPPSQVLMTSPKRMSGSHYYRDNIKSPVAEYIHRPSESSGRSQSQGRHKRQSAQTGSHYQSQIVDFSQVKPRVDTNLHGLGSSMRPSRSTSVISTSSATGGAAGIKSSLSHHHDHTIGRSGARQHQRAPTTTVIRTRRLSVDSQKLISSVEKSIRKYKLETKLFEELQNLKRQQIRSGQANEAVLVKRLIEHFRHDIKQVGMDDYKGAYNYKSYEMFLYDQLRKLSTSNRAKLGARQRALRAAGLLPPPDDTDDGGGQDGATTIKHATDYDEEVNITGADGGSGVTYLTPQELERAYDEYRRANLEADLELMRATSDDHHELSTKPHHQMRARSSSCSSLASLDREAIAHAIEKEAKRLERDKYERDEKQEGEEDGDELESGQAEDEYYIEPTGALEEIRVLEKKKEKEKKSSKEELNANESMNTPGGLGAEAGSRRSSISSQRKSSGEIEMDRMIQLPLKTKEEQRRLSVHSDQGIKTTLNEGRSFIDDQQVASDGVIMIMQRSSSSPQLEKHASDLSESIVTDALGNLTSPTQLSRMGSVLEGISGGDGDSVTRQLEKLSGAIESDKDDAEATAGTVTTLASTSSMESVIEIRPKRATEDDAITTTTINDEEEEQKELEGQKMILLRSGRRKSIVNIGNKMEVIYHDVGIAIDKATDSRRNSIEEDWLTSKQQQVVEETDQSKEEHEKEAEANERHTQTSIDIDGDNIEEGPIEETTTENYKERISLSDEAEKPLEKEIQQSRRKSEHHEDDLESNKLTKGLSSDGHHDRDRPGTPDSSSSSTSSSSKKSPTISSSIASSSKSSKASTRVSKGSIGSVKKATSGISQPPTEEADKEDKEEEEESRDISIGTDIDETSATADDGDGDKRITLNEEDDMKKEETSTREKRGALPALFSSQQVAKGTAIKGKRRESTPLLPSSRLMASTNGFDGVGSRRQRKSIDTPYLGGLDQHYTGGRKEFTMYYQAEEVATEFRPMKPDELDELKVPSSLTRSSHTIMEQEEPASSRGQSVARSPRRSPVRVSTSNRITPTSTTSATSRKLLSRKEASRIPAVRFQVNVPVEEIKMRWAKIKAEERRRSYQDNSRTAALNHQGMASSPLRRRTGSQPDLMGPHSHIEQDDERFEGEEDGEQTHYILLYEINKRRWCETPRQVISGVTPSLVKQSTIKEPESPKAQRQRQSQMSPTKIIRQPAAPQSIRSMPLTNTRAGGRQISQQPGRQLAIKEKSAGGGTISQVSGSRGETTTNLRSCYCHGCRYVLQSEQDYQTVHKHVPTITKGSNKGIITTTKKLGKEEELMLRRTKKMGAQQRTGPGGILVTTTTKTTTKTIRAPIRWNEQTVMRLVDISLLRRTLSVPEILIYSNDIYKRFNILKIIS